MKLFHELMLTNLSIFGRIVPGILADKFGRNNVQALVSYLAGIVVLSFGIASSGNTAYIIYAAFYGFASGGFVSLAPAQITYISKVEQIGVRMGVLFSVCSFAGLFSNPAAGQIVKSGFDRMSIFSGVLLLGGAILFTITRMYLAKWKLFVKI
jgi:MFS family permease